MPIRHCSHCQGLTMSKMCFTAALLLLAVLCLTHKTAVQPHSMLSASGFAASCAQHLLWVCCSHLSLLASRSDSSSVRISPAHVMQVVRHDVDTNLHFHEVASICLLQVPRKPC